jgi:hypothetical protein
MLNYQRVFFCFATENRLHSTCYLRWWLELTLLHFWTWLTHAEITNQQLRRVYTRFGISINNDAVARNLRQRPEGRLWPSRSGGLNFSFTIRDPWYPLVLWQAQQKPPSGDGWNPITWFQWDVVRPQRVHAFLMHCEMLLSPAATFGVDNDHEQIWVRRCR